MSTLSSIPGDPWSYHLSPCRRSYTLFWASRVARAPLGEDGKDESHHPSPCLPGAWREGLSVWPKESFMAHEMQSPSAGCPSGSRGIKGAG